MLALHRALCGSPGKIYPSFCFCIICMCVMLWCVCFHLRLFSGKLFPGLTRTRHRTVPFLVFPAVCMAELSALDCHFPLPASHPCKNLMLNHLFFSPFKLWIWIVFYTWAGCGFNSCTVTQTGWSLAWAEFVFIYHITASLRQLTVQRANDSCVAKLFVTSWLLTHMCPVNIINSEWFYLHGGYKVESSW